jgi:hypothetical protein
MSTAEQWVRHYERLLAGSMSPWQRSWAERELAFWREQLRRQAPHRDTTRPPFEPDPLARWAVRLQGGTYRQARSA